MDKPLNPIEVYSWAGKRAAIAMNHQDGTGYQFERRHYEAMRAMERPEYRSAAEEAYRQAYVATRVIGSL